MNRPLFTALLSLCTPLLTIGCDDTPADADADADSDGDIDADGDVDGDADADGDGDGDADADGDVDADADADGDRGVLRRHPTNPRYFTDGSGEAIYMTGSETWYIQQGNWERPAMTLEQFEVYLDWLESLGHNFLRFWINFSYLGLDGEGAESQGPWPWARTDEEAEYPPGAMKFDLLSWNESYWDKLVSFVEAIESRGMYASIIVFGSANGLRSDFQHTAWYRGNNVQGNPGGPLEAFQSLDDFFNPSSQALELQHALMEKTVRELNHFGNIIWETMNEPGGDDLHPGVMDWRNSMVESIRELERGLVNQHLVVMGGGYRVTQEELYTSLADVISPQRPRSDVVWTDDYREGGPASYGASDGEKVVLNDTDHLWGFSCLADEPAIRRWVWMSFARGNHAIFMDNYDSDPSGSCPGDSNPGNFEVDPEWDDVRAAMGHTQRYASSFVDLAAMAPEDDGSECSTTFCLRNPGVEYFFYQPESGAFTAQVADGTYEYEWFDPEGGVVGESGEMTVESPATFTPPIPGEAVLHLRAP